jgi:HlyD family secretion protein
MKTVIGIVILAAIVGGVYYLNDFTRREDGQSLLHVARELEILVETAKPEQRGIIKTVQAPGEVEACSEVDISSEVMGKVIELAVEEGQWVEQGQLLCRLDDVDYRAQVLSAEANVARLKALITQVEADLEKAERDYNRQKEFIEQDLTSQVELSNYRTIYIGAKASLEMRHQELLAAEAGLQSAKEDLEKTIIRAPLSGVVAQLFAEQGEVVITGTMNNPGTRVMVISDLSKMQVRCRVDEADAPLVKGEQTARVYLQSDTHKSIPGKVLRVCAKGTKQAGRDVVTFETLVLVAGEDERVKPGMSASVEIEVAQDEHALTIPVQAVVYRKQRDLPAKLLEEFERQRQERAESEKQQQAEYVRLIFCVENGKAVPRLVETGINDIAGVQILKGVSAEDTVVVGPYRSLDILKEGSPVKLKEELEKKPEAAAPVADKPADTAPAAASQPAEEKQETVAASSTAAQSGGKSESN